MNKIVIVGCPGSGKTTLANKLGAILDIPVHHLDKVFWVQKGGIDQNSFTAKQEEMMRGDRWIVDGNYMKSKSFDVRLSNADTIIFFKFPKMVIYFRLLKRLIKHFNKSRPDMPDTHRELLRWNLLKFIWNYPTEEIRLRVLAYSKVKKVIILSSKKSEELFLKKVCLNKGNSC